MKGLAADFALKLLSDSVGAEWERLVLAVSCFPFCTVFTVTFDCTGSVLVALVLL